MPQGICSPGLLCSSHAVEGVVGGGFELQRCVCAVVPAERFHALPLYHVVERKTEKADDEEDDDSQGQGVAAFAAEHSSLHDGFCRNFRFCREARCHLFGSVGGQSLHAEFDGLLLEFGGGGVLVDHLAQRLGHRHHLEEAYAALVAASAAGKAVRVLASALGAGLAHQALRHDEVDGGCDEERFDSHVDETHHGGGRVVCMQRAEYEMPGEGCADGEFRRLAVADFAHHDDVWVLTQQCAQGGCEREVNLGVYRSLGDAVQLVFDRLFDCGNVQFCTADHLQ